MYPQRSVMTCGLATALEPPHFNHAPVRGAIGASFSRRSRAGSFNPRTRVATGGRAAAWLSTKSFNPRTRVGCDPLAIMLLNTDFSVSIHAPAWGATCPHRRSWHDCGVSIHAPAWGATRLRLILSLATRFQSTHPRGVRRLSLRLRRGLFRVSIHAPAWGATP